MAARSAEAAEAIGAQLHVALSRSLQGRALAAAGERQEAVAVLRRAERELDECGSLRVRDETRRELRRLGARAETHARPPSEGGSGLASLTKREFEIATLATDRKTNREIAAELFLSLKTVESHMRHIFQKLNVSSRVEVARAIEHARRQLDGPQQT
jgi:DNA-binding NarL/FixJ family response regulator